MFWLMINLWLFQCQEFAVPDYRSSHLEVSQASQLLQQQQLRRRPSLLSEFHPGSDRWAGSFVFPSRTQPLRCVDTCFINVPLNVLLLFLDNFINPAASGRLSFIYWALLCLLIFWSSSHNSKKTPQTCFRSSWLMLCSGKAGGLGLHSAHLRPWPWA